MNPINYESVKDFLYGNKQSYFEQAFLTDSEPSDHEELGEDESRLTHND